MIKYILFLFFLLFIFKTNVYTEANPIPILMSSNNSIYMKNLSGFQFSFKSQTKIYFLSSIVELNSFFNNIDSENYPFIVTIGNKATEVARKYIQKTPILFVMVNYPHSFGIHEGKICGFTADVSVKHFFEVLKKIKPDAKKIYSFYLTDTGEYFSKEGKYYDIWMQLNLYSKKLKNKEQLSKKLETIKNDTDAIYMVFDSLYDRETFELVSKFCKENSIVLMTYYPNLVQIGATFALAPDYTNMGIQAGKYSNKLLQEKWNCNIGPIFSPEHSFLYLNKKYARESNITLSKDVLERERKEKLLAYGIELYNKKKYNSAKSVFTSVLKLNSEDKLAKKFLNEIVNLQTSKEINTLLHTAEKFRKNRDYQNAISVYKKILNLNPNTKGIQQEIDKSVFEKSEHLRLKAKNLSKSQPFQAIVFYKEAIKIYPENRKAEQEYQEVVQKEKNKINDYFQDAMRHYNAREYEEAIRIFENILLVDPNNKSSKEYLYTSKLKRDAYNRLMDCKRSDRNDCHLWLDK